MSDLIDRQAALDCFHEWVDKYGNVYQPDDMPEYMAIEALPSAEPKKGKWINYGQYDTYFPHNVYRCSECDQPYLEIEMTFNFCPNCGARMED